MLWLLFGLFSYEPPTSRHVRSMLRPDMLEVEEELTEAEERGSGNPSLGSRAQVKNLAWCHAPVILALGRWEWQAPWSSLTT